jgi:hypothetical protein
MSIELLEEVVNEVSDSDRSWWPFLWLRPAKHVELSLRRLVTIAVLYGGPMSALVGTLLVLLVPHARPAVPGVMTGVAAVFLFVPTVVIGPMWNRRAKRLGRRVDIDS